MDGANIYYVRTTNKKVYVKGRMLVVVYLFDKAYELQLNNQSYWGWYEMWCLL